MLEARLAGLKHPTTGSAGILPVQIFHNVSRRSR